MFRTLYIVLRDTGRRPREACSLRVECVEHATDGALLIWDNHKIGRRNRRLPITAATAQALTDWQQVRAGLTTGDIRDRYLFSARTLGVPDPFFMPQNLTDGIRIRVRTKTSPNCTTTRWITTVNGDPSTGNVSTRTHFGIPTRNGTPTRGCPSTCCGISWTTEQTSTTQGYYRVTQKRKRDAVRTLHRQVIDRTGNSARAPSQTAYEFRLGRRAVRQLHRTIECQGRRWSCPIRFQCSGCGYYRADPSYIPAIEDHIQALRGGP